MKQMNRRDFLKAATVLGAGAVVAGLPLWKANGAEQSFFLVTNTPDEDARRLFAAFRRNPWEFRIKTSTIHPSHQDLTWIKNGHLIDPVKAGFGNASVSGYAKTLRRRVSPGKYFVMIEPAGIQRKNVVTIEQNGQTVESINLQKNYNRISISGSQSDVVFRLRDGQLDVMDAGCKHELCKRMGVITHGRIICAPNKIVATLIPDRALDGITG